ncbi:MAG: hypothetical protein PHW74_14660 [Desulfobacca sp.]|nr:hypothetical protein [Desulfobacca sp.]
MLNPQNKYKIVMDESWHHSQGEDRETARKWFEMVPCRGGAAIYLFSENPPTLALYTPRKKNAVRICQEVKGTRADLLDGEAVVYFSPEFLGQVAALARAKQKRRLSPEHKKKLTEAGKVALQRYRELNSNDQFLRPDLTETRQAIG